MEGTISLREALQIMESGKPFDIQFVTADRNRGTGGSIRTLIRIVKHNKKNTNATPAAQSLTGVKKYPKHYENSTRNLFNPREKNRNKQIVKVHVRLITHINGLRVT